MYKVELTGYGIKLVFDGFMREEEIARWAAEFEEAVRTLKGNWGVLVDMRTLAPLPPESQQKMVDIQALARKSGMTRSVVILNDFITTMQFKRLAKQSGIYATERYIDASSVANWEQVGLNWITKEVDPDK